MDGPCSEVTLTEEDIIKLDASHVGHVHDIEFVSDNDCTGVVMDPLISPKVDEFLHDSGLESLMLSHDGAFSLYSMKSVPLQDLEQTLSWHEVFWQK